MLLQYVITRNATTQNGFISYKYNTLTDDMLQLPEQYFTDKLHVVNASTCHNSW